MFTRHLSHSNINLTGISISFPESGKKNLARYSTEQYNLPGHRGHWILFKCTPNKMVWVESKHFKRVAAWHSNTMGQWQPKTHSPVDGRRSLQQFCWAMQHHATSGFRSHLAWQVASSFAAPNKYRQKRRAELFKVQMKKANPEMLSPMTQSDLNLCTSCTRCWSEMWKDARCM